MLVQCLRSIVYRPPLKRGMGKQVLRVGQGFATIPFKQDKYVVSSNGEYKIKQ